MFFTPKCIYPRNFRANRRTVFGLVLLLLALNACSLIRSAPTEISATPTRIPTVTRTSTVTRPGMVLLPSPTDANRTATAGRLAPSATSGPSLTPTLTPPDWGTVPARCNWAQFINHVTYPDNSVIVGASTIVKTWRVKNIGSCAWTGLYSLVYQGLLWGYDPFIVPSPIYLSRIIRPGEIADISIEMTAPRIAGDYTAYWVLRSDKGEVFGLGPKADQALWIKVWATGLTLTPTHTPTITPTITMTPTNTATPTSTSAADKK